MIESVEMDQQNDEEEFEAALETLETAAGHIRAAIRQLRLDGAVSGSVENHIIAAVEELGGKI